MYMYMYMYMYKYIYIYHCVLALCTACNSDLKKRGQVLCTYCTPHLSSEHVPSTFLRGKLKVTTSTFKGTTAN